MKKVLLFALCLAIPMVGFAQKKAKKGKNVEEMASAVKENAKRLFKKLLY